MAVIGEEGATWVEDRYLFSPVSSLIELFGFCREITVSRGKVLLVTFSFPMLITSFGLSKKVDVLDAVVALEEL